MCLNEVTFSVGWLAPPVEVEVVPCAPLRLGAVPGEVLELALDSVVAPVISILCPTWSLNLEVSPASW
jgi:hypothetical protein